MTNTGADKGENESYVYDAAGNTTSQTIGSVTTTMAYDRNRLTSTTSGSYTGYRRYDHYGRLVTVDQSDVVRDRYSYDGFDRTVREQKFSAAGALQLDKTQTFDPFDRTVSQTTAITGKPTKSLRFTYLGTSDQVAVEEEKNTAGAWAVAKNYAYGPDGSKLQLTNTPVNDTTKNETQYYGTNPHGDVENVTVADGSAKSTYRYTAYGQPDKKGTTGEDAYSTSTDPATRMAEDLEVDNPYRFTGKRIHGGTGTYDIGFRDYNPGINRYLTRDFYQGALKDLALGIDPWNTNRYAYGGGNPVGGIDLDGHQYDIGNEVAPSYTPHCHKNCDGYQAKQDAAEDRMAAEDEANDAADAETAKEVGLAGCSWIPLLGIGCDTYDAQRTYEEDGLLSWQMAAAAAGFIPGGDIFKTPKQGERIGDAANSVHDVVDAASDPGLLDRTIRGGALNKHVKGTNEYATASASDKLGKSTFAGPGSARRLVEMTLDRGTPFYDKNGVLKVKWDAGVTTGFGPDGSPMSGVIISYSKKGWHGWPTNL